MHKGLDTRTRKGTNEWKSVDGIASTWTGRFWLKSLQIYGLRVGDFFVQHFGRVEQCKVQCSYMNKQPMNEVEQTVPPGAP